ncbi:MAG: bifunctional [glutamine synthetase] adenylyltransferase/[glutamine synthetase]-adenylyl-L-tyrosine phosphorylase [Rickettsiales bacterium]|nr:bifunctional [glutamine synthetase] adenylyltransferase/[glutamine synthetase]-adenylyl-L-tyrosine phosphorylase [Rickettsiales bacterium]
MNSYGYLNSISTLPKASAPEETVRLVEQLRSRYAESPELTESIDLLIDNSKGKELLEALSSNTRFLNRLIELQWPFFIQCLNSSPEAQQMNVLEELNQQDHKTLTIQQLNKFLRTAKKKIALSLAIADISQTQSVMEITRVLSEFAGAAVKLATRCLLYQAYLAREIELTNTNEPELDSGLLILGMGKLGAYELNYSSDIDLIIMFDKETAPYCGTRNIQKFFNRFAQDLQSTMQERTEDGYVFRTDLRLRPDPRSTPLAVNVHAAITYYETLGQNWERAAMIKARQIAGDLKVGELFARSMKAYIWRKHLDFYAINDIHSIKRQMNIKVGEELEVLGHNVKLGRGGIREIEFFVQTKQLVWGGRHPELREKSTLEVLKLLNETGHTTSQDAETLTQAYLFLRRVEHHIQMLDDQQTHTIPDTQKELDNLATFLGYSSTEVFCDELIDHCQQVHRIYSESMEGTPPLAIDGNLVFTGIDADPDTLVTLNKLGFDNANAISDMIQEWHRGNRRATSTPTSRQILTEIVPNILLCLGKTTTPDSAFFRFDDFLNKLPSGTQIFSLLSNRPELMELLSHILGSAPALSEILGKYPQLLDAVLDEDFYEILPDKDQLRSALNHQLLYIQEQEQKLRYLRTFKNERHFQAGVHLMQGITEPKDITSYLSDIAEVICEKVLELVSEEFAENRGKIAQSAVAIIAMGKLGSRELTFGSDLDLVIVYDAEDMLAESDGEKPIDARTYFNRLTSRIVTALTMLTPEGVLYEVDTRLRPAGVDSLIATPYPALEKYFEESAWTFEFMALTKARIVASSNEIIRMKLEKFITTQLQKTRDESELATDITTMRSKIASQYYTTNPWHLKHVRGGVMDCEFFTQYLILRYATEHPDIIQNSAASTLKAAADNKILSKQNAETLRASNRLQQDLLCFLRLCSDSKIDEDYFPTGLAELLAERFHAADFQELKSRLIDAQETVTTHFMQLSET